MHEEIRNVFTILVCLKRVDDLEYLEVLLKIILILKEYQEIGLIVRENVYVVRLQDRLLENEVLAALKMSMLVLRVATPCGFVGRHRSFGVNTMSIFRAKVLKMETVCSSKSS